MRRNGMSSNGLGLTAIPRDDSSEPQSIATLSRRPGSHVTGVHSDLDARWLEVEAISLSGVF
jgi:hypothetical protein